jgi:hypothetical protein
MFLICERSLLLQQFTRKATKPTVGIIDEYHCYQLHTEMYLIYLSRG